MPTTPRLWRARRTSGSRRRSSPRAPSRRRRKPGQRRSRRLRTSLRQSRKRKRLPRTRLPRSRCPQRRRCRRRTSSWTRASRPTAPRRRSRARATQRASLPRLPTSLARPIAVAITGGIGAGKSEALASFRRHGAATVSSDEIVHRLLREDPVVGKTLIDRSAIAEIVFADREALEWLESLLHPLVVQEYLEWREQLAALANPPPLTATEVPLLYEVGGQDRFDAVVVVTAPPRIRSDRSEVDAEEREPRLLPDTVKVAQADFAYVNDGSLEELDAFVGEVVKELTAGSG